MSSNSNNEKLTSLQPVEEYLLSLTQNNKNDPIEPTQLLLRQQAYCKIFNNRLSVKYTGKGSNVNDLVCVMGNKSISSYTSYVY
jgi:hypothetical protein